MKSQSSSSLVDSLAAASSSKKELERRLAQMGLGLVTSLQHAEIPLTHAEKDLFNLDAYTAVRKHRLNPHLVEFLEWGMELEDVAELAPRGLEESYQRMIALARQVIEESLPKTRGTRSRPARVK